MSPTRRAALIAGGVWAAVYALVCVTGEKFTTFWLTIAWQLVPYEVLRADPIRSVWYLHIQPPLWNLVIGGIGRWSPAPDAITLQLLQAGFGVITAAMIAVILLRLRFKPWVAIGLALLATLNPEFMRNAFEPTYEMPVACALVAMVWAITWYRPDRAFPSVLGVAAFSTVVFLTRSLYHPIWAIVMVVIVGLAFRASVPWKRVGVALLIPVLLAGAWMAKNEVLFGRPTFSSWFGMNLQRAVIPVLPLDEKQQMYDDGKISDIAMIGPFGNYGLYRPVVEPCTPSRSHPSLSKELRDNEVVIPNLNYECFLPVYDQAGADARAVIGQYPGVWLKGRVWSARVWFATNQLPDESPSEVYRALSSVYRVIRVDVPGDLSTADWGTPIYGNLTVRTRFSMTMLNLTLFAFGFGVWHAWRLLRRRVAPEELVRSAVLAVVGATALWTFVVGIVGELGEQARFRTMTDPLVLALGLAELLRRLSDDRFLAPVVPGSFQASGDAGPESDLDPGPEPGTGPQSQDAAVGR